MREPMKKGWSAYALSKYAEMIGRMLTMPTPDEDFTVQIDVREDIPGQLKPHVILRVRMPHREPLQIDLYQEPPA